MVICNTGANFAGWLVSKHIWFNPSPKELALPASFFPVGSVVPLSSPAPTPSILQGRGTGLSSSSPFTYRQSGIRHQPHAKLTASVVLDCSLFLFWSWWALIIGIMFSGRGGSCGLGCWGWQLSSVHPSLHPSASVQPLRGCPCPPTTPDGFLGIHF